MFEQLSPIVRLPGHGHGFVPGPSPSVALAGFMPGHLASPFQLHAGLQTSNTLSPSLSPLKNTPGFRSEMLFLSQHGDGDGEDGVGGHSLGSNRRLEFQLSQDDARVGALHGDEFNRFSHARSYGGGADFGDGQGELSRAMGSRFYHERSRRASLSREEDEEGDGNGSATHHAHDKIKREFGELATSVDVPSTTGSAPVVAACTTVQGGAGGCEPGEGSTAGGDHAGPFVPNHRHNEHAPLSGHSSDAGGEESEPGEASGPEADDGGGRGHEGRIVTTASRPLRSTRAAKKRGRTDGNAARLYLTPMNRPGSSAEETPAVLRRINPCNCKKSRCLKLYVPAACLWILLTVGRECDCSGRCCWLWQPALDVTTANCALVNVVAGTASASPATACAPTRATAQGVVTTVRVMQRGGKRSRSRSRGTRMRSAPR